MFLDLFKNLSLKKIIKAYLPKTKEPSKNKILLVGLLIDGTHFDKAEQLINEFSNYGIRKENLKTLVYTKTKQPEHELFSYFSSKDFTLSGEFVNKELDAFVETPFDLLVSYYNKNQIKITYLTAKSKADFKVGFVMEQKNFNHLMIDVPLSDYKLFTQELFKYLKSLNKI
ncbi:MAG TPA: hypothetical protein VLZ11_09860 [Flavobacterium sp.]|nr:hypothetical protein [Flavobacterium sp.]